MPIYMYNSSRHGPVLALIIIIIVILLIYIFKIVVRSTFVLCILIIVSYYIPARVLNWLNKVCLFLFL